MGGPKRLPPSQRKLQRVRKEGDVAKSKEFSGCSTLLAMLLAIPYFVVETSIFCRLVEESFSLPGDFHTNHVLVYAELAFGVLCRTLFPVLVFALLAGTSLQIVQAGYEFSLEPLAFRLSRLNLARGISRIFGAGENVGGIPLVLSNILKSVLGIGICLGLLLLMLMGQVSGVMHQNFLQPSEVFSAGYLMLLQIGIALCAVYAALGCVDLLIQRRRRLKRLSMDVEEFRREMRESEGDPETRAMRKHLYQEFLLQGSLEGVRRAKVVVVSKSVE